MIENTNTNMEGIKNTMENLKELKELTEEELKNLYENNREFSGLVYELAWEDATNAQAEQAELMGAKAFNMHDHYNSFYLTTPSHYGVKDGLSVAGASGLVLKSL